MKQGKKSLSKRMNPETAADVAAEKKVVKITSEIPQAERLQERADGSMYP